MKRLLLLVLVIAFVAGGCSSAPVIIQTPVDVSANKDYTVLGEGEGSATGIMLFQVIPIGQNYKFEAAYKAAIDSKGGDMLLNPVVTESWFWAYILNGYRTNIKGTVVKKNTK